MQSVKSLKHGQTKSKPIAPLKGSDLMNKLVSIINSKPDNSKHLENGIISSAVADILCTDFTVEEAKLLQSHFNTILSIHGEEMEMQNKIFDEHTTAYLKSEEVVVNQPQKNLFLEQLVVTWMLNLSRKETSWMIYHIMKFFVFREVGV